MTDRELLELAANAAGIPQKWNDFWNGFYIQHPDGSWDSSSRWRPLIDDGDALRLAVKLNIEFACFDDHQSVNAGVWSPNGNSWDCLTPYNGDKIAATRCAITRAAAQIGKSMKENI